MDSKKEGRFEKDVSLIVKLLRGPRRRSKNKKEQQATLNSNGSPDNDQDGSAVDKEVASGGGGPPILSPKPLPKPAVESPQNEENTFRPIATSFQKDGLPKSMGLKPSPRSSPRASPRSMRSPVVGRGRIPLPCNSPVRSPAAMRAKSLYASPSRSPGPSSPGTFRGMYMGVGEGHGVCTYKMAMI